MSEEEELMAVVLEAPAASLPRKLKFWSPLTKKELDSELKSVFPFIWWLSKNMTIVKTMKDIVHFIDSLVGLSVSVYPRWRKKDFEETAAKVCNVCGRRHAGGILCFLGAAWMSVSLKEKLSESDEKLVSLEHFQKPEIRFMLNVAGINNRMKSHEMLLERRKKHRDDDAD